MLKPFFLLIIGLSVSPLFGQDKKDLSLSFATGIFTSPYYTNAKAKAFYNFDLSYNITKRHKIASVFIAGKHLYYDNEKSNNAVPLNTPGYEKNANALAEYFTFSILYKYLLYNNNKISITTGAGAGIMTQIVEYPYTEGNITDIRQSAWTDIVFPVRLELDYKLSKRFQFGLLGGLFIHPDYPILGYHVGPRLTYVIQ